MTPEGMEIALLESKLSGNVTTQQALCEYMDDWISAVLMGQEARTKGGGALGAASKERQDVRQDLTQADSDLLSETELKALAKKLPTDAPTIMISAHTQMNLMELKDLIWTTINKE